MIKSCECFLNFFTYLLCADKGKEVIETEEREDRNYVQLSLSDNNNSISRS